MVEWAKSEQSQTAQEVDVSILFEAKPNGGEVNDGVVSKVIIVDLRLREREREINFDIDSDNDVVVAWWWQQWRQCGCGGVIVVVVEKE